MRNGITLAGLLALALAAACDFGPLPPLNPFDPDAPDDLQAPVTITGRVDRDGANVEGLDVRLVPHPGSGDVLGRTSTTENGAFGVSGPSRATHVQFREFGCAIHAEPLGEIAPGQEVDLGVVFIDQVRGDLAVKGRVSTGGALANDAGITVELYRTNAAGAGATCTEKVAETVTQSGGGFSFGNLPGGYYAAAAKSPGLTVDVSPGQELPCDYAGDDFFFDLSLSSVAGRLSVNSTDPEAPPGVSRTERVVFAGDETFDWADTVELSEDATFGGYSEELPFSSQDPLTYPAADDEIMRTVGQTALYARFSSSCGDSPLYAAPVLVDPEPPLLVAFQVGPADVLAQQDGVPAAVIADASPAAAIALDALDASGVRLVIDAVEQVAGQPVRTTVFDQTVTAAENLVSVRDVLVVPPEEGTYRFEAAIADLAGNTAYFLNGAGQPVTAYAFDVIRDAAPPRTPLPAATDITVTDDVALIWLDAYDCGLICEQNPGDNPFYVRGGPAYPDFANVAGPPFVVPVFEEGETEIEVRAVDAAGNPSPGIGRVTVRQARDRTVLDIPSDQVLRTEHRPSLTAGGGTLLAQLVPHHVLADPLQDAAVLVSQPVSTEQVGTDPLTSSRPDMVRKLNLELHVDSFSDLEYNQSQRSAAGLAYGAGLMHWVEWTPSVFTSLGRHNWATFDGNGVISIAPINAYLGGLDPEGVPAPTWDNDGFDGQAVLESQSCRVAGPVRCVSTDAYRSHFDRATLAAAPTGDGGFVVGGMGGQLVRTTDEPVVETRTITGPVLIGTRVSSDIIRGIGSLRLVMDAPAGEVAGVGIYEINGNGLTYDRNRPSNQLIYGEVLLSGAGVELVQDFNGHATRGGNGDVIVGLLVPAGMTVDVPVVSWTNDEVGGVPTGISPTTDTLWLSGLVEFDLGALTAPYGSLDAAAVDAVTEPGLALAFEMSVMPPDYEYKPRFNGLSFVRTADGREPVAMPLAQSQNPAAASPVHMANRGLERGIDFSLSTSSDTLLTVPEESCRIAMRVDEPVTVNNISFNGNGLMDNAYVRLFHRPLAAGPLGTYAPPQPFYETFFSGSFSQGQNLAFRPVEYDQAQGIANCDDIDGGELVNQTFSVTVPTNVLDQVSVNPPAGTAAEVSTGTVTYPEFATVPDPLMATPYAVTPGEVVRVYMTQVSGDSDMYVKLGAPPAVADYDCRPYAALSDEVCTFVIPPGVTELYVAMEAYDPISDFEVSVRRLVEVSEITALPGEDLTVSSSGTQNHSVLVLEDTGAGYPQGYLGFSGDQCGFYSGYYDTFHSCFIAIPDDALTYRIYVDQEVPHDTTTVTATTRYDQTPVFQVGSLPVAAGQNVVVTAPTGPGRLRVGYNDPVTTSDYVCQENLNTANPDPCELLISGDRDAVYIGIEYGDGEATYDVTGVVTATGCTGVEAENPGPYGTDASRVLEPGYYLMTVASYGFPAEWPTSGPGIYTGPAQPGAGAVKVLGAPVSPSYFIGADFVDDRFDVPAIDEGGTVCNVTLDLTAAPTITRVAANEKYAVASYRSTGPDGAVTERLRVMSVDETASQGPVFDQSWPLPDEALTTWGLSVSGTRVTAVLATRAGQFARVREFDIGTDALSEVQPACLVLNEEPTFLQLRDAVFEGPVLTVGGQGVSGAELRVYEREGPAEVGACRSWALRRLKTYPAEEMRGVAQSGGDAFAVLEGVSGARAAHHELRRSGPVYPGGARGVIGYDAADDGALLLAMYDTAQGTGRLMQLHLEPAVAVLDVELPAETVVSQPRFAGAGRFAAFSHSSSGTGLPQLVVAPVSATYAPVALTNATVAGVTGFSPDEPARVGREHHLASDGRYLAALSDPGVQVFDLGAAGLPAADLVPVLDEPLASSNVRNLVMKSGGLLVTYADRSADLWLFDDANPEVVHRHFDGLDERAVGLTDTGVIFLQPPVTIQTGRTPMFFDVAELSFAALVFGDDAKLPLGTMPSGAYFHRFPAVAPTASGDLIVQDIGAPVPVLWRLSKTHGRTEPVDGSLRPLTSSDDTALNAVRVAGDWVYYVKARGLGYALYRMELR